MKDLHEKFIEAQALSIGIKFPDNIINNLGYYKVQPDKKPLQKLLKKYPFIEKLNQDACDYANQQTGLNILL